jgi:purine-binding chemotaxis protein CheW
MTLAVEKMLQITELIEEDTQHGKYLTFNIGEEAYGIEIKHVTEIIGIQPIAAVPKVPSFVKGIINLRGKIIPVIDVRSKFNKEEADYDERTCIIVVDVKDTSVGLIVDKVADVLTIVDGEIVDPPDTKTGFRNNYVKGVGKVGTEVKLLLDCEKLLWDGCKSGEFVE